MSNLTYHLCLHRRNPDFRHTLMWQEVAGRLPTATFAQKRAFAYGLASKQASKQASKRLRQASKRLHFGSASHDA